MDTDTDTDTDESSEEPFDESLIPAVRPVDDGGDRDATVDPGGDAAGATGESDAATAASGGAVGVEDLTGPRRTLEPTIQAVWLLQAVVPSLVIGGLLAAGFAFLPVGDPWMGGVVALAVFLVAAALAVLRYRSWAYEVREDSLYLERGVITNVRTVVPYVRIQHVDASRGPVERAFGLATTVVYTAGSRGADVSIPGLTPERAEDLQARLKRLAIAAEGEDAV